MRTTLPSALLVPLVLGGSGCFLFSSGESTPEPIAVAIEASQRLNPDEQGQSLPTLVRIYQLRSAARFDAAEFDELYRREKEALGEDLVQVEEVQVAPGGSVSRTLPRDKATKALGLAAVVRRPAGSSW
jgi:type VI secretion system protein VasD